MVLTVDHPINRTSYFPLRSARGPSGGEGVPGEVIFYFHFSAYQHLRCSLIVPTQNTYICPSPTGAYGPLGALVHWAFDSISTEIVSTFCVFMANTNAASSYLDGAVTSDVAGNGCRGPAVPAILRGLWPIEGFAPFGSLAPSRAVLLNFAPFWWLVLIAQK